MKTTEPIRTRRRTVTGRRTDTAENQTLLRLLRSLPHLSTLSLQSPHALLLPLGSHGERIRETFSSLCARLIFSSSAMDSWRKASSLSRFFPCLFLLICSSLLLHAPSSSSTSRISLAASSSESEKVSLIFYYESLCPYCSNFIVNELVSIFDNGLISIIDLKLVPYGNAKLGPNDTISCQHGPSECLLNTIEACAINVWPDLKEHFPFIYCVESLVYEHKYPQWTECFDKLGLDSKPIFDCYSSGYGKELELQYAAETNTLQPPHKYVPWVVVDGEPLYEDYENFTTYVCKAYKGTAVPEVCSELSLKGVPKEEQIPINPVCYTEKTAETTLSTKIGSAITSWMHWPSM